MPVLPPDGVRKSVVVPDDEFVAGASSGVASSGAVASSGDPSSGEDSSGVASEVAMTSGGW